MSRIQWSEQAVADVREIRAFIARDAPYSAELFVDRIVTAVERLEQFPFSGRIVPEIGRSDVREVVFGSYRVVYRISDASVVAIVTLFHSARLLRASDVLGAE